MSSWTKKRKLLQSGNVQSQGGNESYHPFGRNNDLKLG